MLDPYIGGGTTVVEALVAGRQIIGNDLNSLATFVTKVKTTPLSPSEVKAIRKWSAEIVPRLTYWFPRELLEPYFDSQKLKNMDLVSARFIKKAIAAALATMEELSTPRSRAFVRCVVLRVAQRALDGRKTRTSVDDFRSQLSGVANEMLIQLEAFRSKVTSVHSGRVESCFITNKDASGINMLPVFTRARRKVSLVVMTGYLVYKAYQASFNSGEQLRLQSFLPDTQEIGRGVIFGNRQIRQATKSVTS
ncbi:MAG: hypothetical protein H0V18_14790 [Pyrinomonadaceae bacterium]|nr:hypothetical protein [Pyrinomonadaceae bacterium]